MSSQEMMTKVVELLRNVPDLKIAEAQGGVIVGDLEFDYYIEPRPAEKGYQQTYMLHDADKHFYGVHGNAEEISMRILRNYILDNDEYIEALKSLPLVGN